MNIHRQKKLNKIAQSKDDICKHLTAGNEVNAKIWCETLINDEALVPCYDVACTMCDQVKGRLEYISKQGAPRDMNQTFATIIHVAPKLDVEELTKVRKQLTSLMGKEFAQQADEDKGIINPVVAKGIDFKIPSDGEVIYRMRQLAKERNISYTPSFEMQNALNSYLDMNGLSDPFNEGQAPQQNYSAVPQYNPGMPPNQPPSGGNGGGGQTTTTTTTYMMPQQPMGVPQQPMMVQQPGMMPMVQPQPVPQYYMPSVPPQQPLQPGMNSGQPAGDPNMYQPATVAPAGHVGDPVIGQVVQPDKQNSDDLGPPQQPQFNPNQANPVGPKATGPPQIGGGNYTLDAPTTGVVDISDLEARFKALDGM